MPPKVLVSGTFDLLHSGHVAFLEEAASYGDLHVCVGRDDVVHALKGRYPVNAESERQYMIRALRCVKECRISRGQGLLDFEPELREIRPDLLVVNADGAHESKAALCRELGVRYVVLERIPAGALPPRSTTALRTECVIPYRIDLAGGWLDQPWVSKDAPGAVLTISIEPTHSFNERSGMATSTRKKAIALWCNQLPEGNPEQIAKVLFSYENPPGTVEVAGSQDSIGIVMPGLNRSDYRGEYWPRSITSDLDEGRLSWLEQRLWLVALDPRESGYSVLSNTNVTPAGAAALAAAADACWDGIQRMDAAAVGRAITASFEAQIAMFPHMVARDVPAMIDQYRARALGWKLSGAGGGGYLTLFSEQPIEGALRVTIRRRHSEL
jgi:cytidyltransferase-like protein